MTEAKKRFARGSLIDVVDPSPHRRAVECTARHNGCGGCDWLAVDPAYQAELRRQIVVDTLERIGKIASPNVVAGPQLPIDGYRTVIRAAVGPNGQAGFRAAHSHDVVPTEACQVAHPLAAELLTDVRYPEDCSEVQIVVGARTGERMIVIDSDAEPDNVPSDVVVARQGSGVGSITEVVAGVTFRISAGSFFQCRPDGAEALVDLVTEGLRDAEPGPMVDAYCGVGLFAATVGGTRDVAAIELSPSSVADARFNLANRRPATIVTESAVERWPVEPAAVVVADPARRGLGPKAVDVVSATGASRLVLISCDAASLGRDARLLAGHGFSLDRSVVVDLFGQTSHVEVVSTFSR